MKFRIPRNDLTAALALVKTAAATRGSLPMLSHVAIRANEKSVEFCCTDLDITVRTRIAADINQSGDTTVRVALLHDLVRSLPDETIMLAAAKSTLRVTGVAARSGGGSDYELSTLDIEEFPPTTRVKEGVEFQLPEQDLHAALSATAFAMSTEAARLVLCGTYVSLNGTLQLVATDGRRLALDLAGETDAKEPAEVILPARAVHELLKLLDAGSDRKVTGVIGKNAAQFHLADTTLNCKVIEGTYPNYRQVMPSEDSARVKCPIGRADLLAALRRVALVSPEQCELEIAGQMLTVRGLGKDVGRACETLLVPKCEPVTLKFKPAYLIEGLAAVAAEEVVFVASADEATPAMFRLKDSTAWTYVVCPMRDPAPAPAPAAPVPETETKSETKSKK